MQLTSLLASPALRPSCAAGRAPLQPVTNVRVPVFVQAPKIFPEASRNARLEALCCRAASRDESHSPEFSFDLGNVFEAKVDSVRKTERYGHVIFLRLDEPGNNNLLPVYIGDFETSALVNQINHQPTMRPMTHDLMSNSLTMLGFKVTKVCITAMVGRTYHARIHYSHCPSQDSLGVPVQGEVNIDARPSDAINLAVRFNAPIYVNREVANKMAHPAQEIQTTSETVTEIERSCRDDIKHFPDPTLHLQLQLQLAIGEENYSEAHRLRNEIDSLLVGDRALSLVVAIQSALADQRFEEAQRLRDELRQLKALRFAPEKQDA